MNLDDSCLFIVLTKRTTESYGTNEGFFVFYTITHYVYDTDLEL